MKFITLLLTPTLALAAVNGRCSGGYNDGLCICLDHDTCTGTYNGYAVEGSGGNYPCPSDASNIWGCYITRNCPTKGSGSACTWTRNPNGCEYGSFITGMSFSLGVPERKRR